MRSRAPVTMRVKIIRTEDKMDLDNTIDQSRRTILHFAGGGLLAALVPAKSKGPEEHEAKFKVFDEKTRIDIGSRGKEIITRAYQLGHEYEGKHGGCCRCTVAALQGAMEFIPADEDVFRTACCLDGGATPTGVQSCGGFTGSGIIIGYLCGSAPFGNTRLCHKLIREVYGKFKEAYGSVLCKDVRAKGKRNCPEIVGTAARWATGIILRRFANYEGK